MFRIGSRAYVLRRVAKDEIEKSKSLVRWWLEEVVILRVGPVVESTLEAPSCRHYEVGTFTSRCFGALMGVPWADEEKFVASEHLMFKSEEEALPALDRLQKEAMTKEG